jgi:hypothetical protein
VHKSDNTLGLHVCIPVEIRLFFANVIFLLQAIYFLLDVVYDFEQHSLVAALLPSSFKVQKVVFALFVMV